MHNFRDLLIDGLAVHKVTNDLQFMRFFLMLVPCHAILHRQGTQYRDVKSFHNIFNSILVLSEQTVEGLHTFYCV